MIRICANLAKTINNNRVYFYKEFEYQIGNYKKVSIKRGFDYYISIEELVKPKDRDKVFIRIGPSEYYGFMDLIQEAMKWFTSSKYSKLFAKKGGELVFTGSTPSKTLTGLPMNLSLTLSPCIVDTGKEFKPAVQITVDNNIDDLIDFYMSVDSLFGVYGALVNYNMFMSAQIMVSSLGIPLGTNRVDLSDESNSNPLPDHIEVERTPTSSNIIGRVIGGPKLEDLG